MSYPDITLLPQLAAYFNLSIDELMGYEPQMTKEQMRDLYRQLASDFSSRPAEELFERVKAETDDVDLAKQALNMEALCLLSLGRPKDVLDLLGNPDFSMTSAEPLLASAYHLLGDKKEARSILQVGIYQYTVGLINMLSIYLGLCLDREDVFEETCRRSFAIVDAFDLKKLHPGIILPLYFTVAQGYMKLEIRRRRWKYWSSTHGWQPGVFIP